MSWGEANFQCEANQYFRLTKLTTKIIAKELVGNITKISTPYTPEYDTKNKEVEFGMNRRYWIGKKRIAHTTSLCRIRTIP